VVVLDTAGILPVSCLDTAAAGYQALAWDRTVPMTGASSLRKVRMDFATGPGSVGASRRPIN